MENGILQIFNWLKTLIIKTLIKDRICIAPSKNLLSTFILFLFSNLLEFSIIIILAKTQLTDITWTWSCYYIHSWKTKRMETKIISLFLWLPDFPKIQYVFYLMSWAQEPLLIKSLQYHFFHLLLFPGWLKMLFLELLFGFSLTILFLAADLLKQGH